MTDGWNGRSNDLPTEILPHGTEMRGSVLVESSRHVTILMWKEQLKMFVCNASSFEVYNMWQWSFWEVLEGDGGEGMGEGSSSKLGVG